MIKKLQINISGRVQGVGFRKAAKKVADKLKITGYAKNLIDGTVEILAIGQENSINQFIPWTMKGSLLSDVRSVKIDKANKVEKYLDFSVIRDSDIVRDQIRAFKNLGKDVLNLPDDITLPKHIAIICDGNRRWAKERGLDPWEGHKAGAERIRSLVDEAREIGVKYLTLWAFSTENWNRDEKEVSKLMELTAQYFVMLENEFHKNHIKFTHLGRKDRLPEKVLKSINLLEESTKDYSDYFLNVAMDYGGRDEIVRATKKAISSGVSIEELDENYFSGLLDSKDIPDPDMIIRTSGELRLSGLLPWQSTYSELYFTEIYLPDFDINELKKAILEFSKRSRRMGK